MLYKIHICQKRNPLEINHIILSFTEYSVSIYYVADIWDTSLKTNSGPHGGFILINDG